MLSSKIKAVHVLEHRIDFRKSFNGLLGESYKAGLDPYAGDCVVFIKTDRSQIRILVGDDEGLFLLSRRFEGSSLSLSWIISSEPSRHSISQAELSMLLEGASYVVKRRVKKWKA